MSHVYRVTFVQSAAHLARVLSLKRHPGAAVALCALLGTVLPAAFGLIKGIPEPQVHDEFSYLLAADTFAHGRLTNPTPDLPEFFEAEHVLLVPTYMSKFPPGQGVALAMGQVLLGHPIWGVWLSFGCFAASLCWMLQAWTSKGWAFAITALAIVSLGLNTYWTQSYWGGTIAACGGALLFGGMRRTLCHARLGASLLMALGVVVLAASRPFEGALACVPVAAVISWWLIARPGERLPAKIKRWALPFLAIVLVGGLAIAKYNHAVTGQWLRMPYTVHQRQYFYQYVFIFSGIRPPERQANDRVARFYERHQFIPSRGFAVVWKALGNFGKRLPAVFLGALGDIDAKDRGIGGLLWMGAILVVTLRNRWTWFCLLTIAFVVLGGSLAWGWFPHYSAPVLPLVMAIFADALHRIGMAFRANRKLGSLTPAIVVSLAGFYGLVVLGGTAVLARQRNKTEEVSSEIGRVASRGDLIRRLNQQDGSHLVFVHYAEDYTINDEWVYNAADIQAAKIVFAHDLGAKKNRQLVARYPGRSLWLVTVDAKEKRLQLYRAAERAGPGT